MKKILKYPSMMLAVLMVFACQKEKSFEQGNHGGTGVVIGDFRAKINGVDWAAADNAKGATIVAGIISVAGISTDNKQISITLNGSTTGTYVLDQNSYSAAAYVDGQSGNTVAYTTNAGLDTTIAGGSVTITEIDQANKTISGTFHFKVFRESDQQQQVITEGVFTKLTYSSTLPPAASTDSFFVKVDGTPWTPPSISASVSAGSLVIAASELDASRSIGLVMPETVTVGVHALDFAGGQYIGEYNPSASTFLIADANGTLTILENNSSTRRIKGQFQFTANDIGGSGQKAVLTEGSFSVGY